MKKNKQNYRHMKIPMIDFDRFLKETTSLVVEAREEIGLSLPLVKGKRDKSMLLPAVFLK